MAVAVAKLWERFSDFCYNWYDIQEDCLFFLVDVKKSRYRHLSRDTRDLLFSNMNQTNYVHYLNEMINQQKENLQSVFNMFTSVGFTSNQAKTLVNILCTKNCSLQNRQKLVSLYEEILLIAPFVQKNAFKSELKYQKRLEQTLIEFNLHVQNMICGEGKQIAQRENDIQKLLANNVLLDHRDQITTHLIKSAGCIQPDIHVNISSNFEKKEEETQEQEQEQEQEQKESEIIQSLIKRNKHEKKKSRYNKKAILLSC